MRCRAARGQRAASRKGPAGGVGLGRRARSRDRPLITDPFRDLGWIDGQNIGLVYRWAVEGREQDRLVAELVLRPVDLLFVGGTSAALAAQMTTSVIPIVFYGVGDPAA
jgi:hypothetical protein